MSSEQTYSTNDLRSTAQDHKRDAARKAKWQLGAVERVGRNPGNPRPFRPSETAYNFKRRESKAAVASLAYGAKPKMARKHDMLDGNNAVSSDSDASNASSDDAPSSPLADVGVMYSFDAAKGPTQGSQILNSALAKAVERFEEKETARLVRNEYDVLDSEGESVGLANPRKGTKGKERAVVVGNPDEEEDYEFV